MNTKGIAVGVSADLRPLQQSFGRALSEADRFERNLSNRLNKLDTGNAAGQVEKIAKAFGKIDTGKTLVAPARPEAGTGQEDAKAQADAMAGAVAPLAAQIGTSLQKSMTPLVGFAARFGQQFEKVGGTIITLSRRIDESMKFPKFQAWITNARAEVQSFAAQSEGTMARFARGVDASLGGIKGFLKLRNFVMNLGDVSGSVIGKLNGMKSPAINFDGSTRSITNFYGATKLATGGLKAFALQASLALGFVGLGFKAVAWIKEGITGATDLGETMSKVKEVFGQNTDAVTKQADVMAAKFGMNKKVTLDAAAGFGLMGKAAGLSSEKSGELANNFTKLAGDVSSFYNIPIDQALEKLRSGLAGEAEPMRALGVLLSEDAVKAEAWRSGIAKVGAELSDQQKVMARAALIQGGLSTATGDLERTQGSAANQARQFAGNMTNLATTIGEFFMPAVGKALGLLNEFGSYLGRVFEENKATLQSWGQSLAGVFDTVGVLFRNLPEVFEVGKLRIVEGLANLVNRFEAFGTNVSMIGRWAADNFLNFFRDAFSILQQLNRNLAWNFAGLGKALVNFLANPTQGFKVDWTPMLDGFKSTLSEMPKLVGAEVTDLSAEIGKHTDKIIANEAARDAAMGGPTKAAKRGVIATGMGEPQDLKALKDLNGFSDKIKDAIKTPFEKFKEGMDQLARARAAGLLTDDQFEKGKAQVAKDSGINAETKFAAASDLGSKEAYSTVVAAISGKGGMASMEKSGQMTATNTASAAASLKVLAQRANAREIQFEIA